MVAYSGSVKIGGVELAMIPRMKVRQLICAVPQDPLVLKGSLRINLDPGGKYHEDEIVQCIRLSGLHDQLKVRFW